jgi:Lipopolysaccharide-assembly
MIKRVVMGSLLLVVAFGMPGCGVYSANSGRVDESIKRVFVEYLENMTAEPNLGVDIAEGIIEALQIDNTLKVVEEGEADSVISGKVMRYNLKEVFTTENLTVNEYQVQLAVILSLNVRATGEAVFKNKRFTGTGNYVLDESAEEDARKEAIAEIVRDILAQVMEGW